MSNTSSQPAHSKGIALVITAIGVVFGDIGTSPLYTFKEALSPHYGLDNDHDTVLGVLSLAFWALNVVVTLKYVTLIMRADNEGEGGIMALMALARRSLGEGSRAALVISVAGIFGAALFFGDGVISPAISVLGAVEGLQVAAPALAPFIIPISLTVLALVFSVQRFGTAKVGNVFGPVMVVWFITLAALGIWNIFLTPEVLKAFNPIWAVRFFSEQGWHGVFIFGAVVLAVTGGESLYADMGHFGARPIRHGWYFFVLPCLVLNYFGQGAYVLQHPQAVANPFYACVPEIVLYPVIVLATLAAVIASQSIITGAFSMAHQAMQLGFIPRMRVRHTSQDSIGQIYIPAINWALAAMVFALVLVFGSSSNLAVAYGISVSATMLIDTLLLTLVARALWPHAWLRVVLLCVVFLFIDLSFVVANAVKLLQGAWFPVILGLLLFTLMRTWQRGRALLVEEIRKDGLDMPTFLPALMLAPPLRVPGTAIFLSADLAVVPHALLHNLKHNKVLHEHNVFLHVKTLTVPWVAANKRAQIMVLGENFYQIQLNFGFMQTPNVPRALNQAREQANLVLDPMDTTYFIGRHTIAIRARPGLPIWRNHLFAFMRRNAAPATGFFRIPGNRLVELGTEVKI